jgi:NAD(P)-dependent dehydrogenase (short-subunit alcohol dehydrogenase family)
LVIVNAGMSTHIGPDGAGEPWEDVQALIEVNVLAAMAIVDAVLPSMRARGQGQIALISSLGGLFWLAGNAQLLCKQSGSQGLWRGTAGLAGAGGHSCQCGDAGLCRVQRCAGTRRGPKPFLWPPEKAALAIKRGLARNQPRISFPFPLNLGTWFLSVLRPGMSQWILRRLNYGG